jgi:transcriptional regulator with XRE-family HTH domain
MALSKSEEKAFQKRAGEALRRARETAGMTQAALAEAVDMDPVTISRFENGHTLPGLLRLLAMADVLNVSLALLLGSASARSHDEHEEFRLAASRLTPKERRLALALMDAIVAARG